MPSKKKKYNARFPAGRIKKIMQSDEEIGKVAQAVPVIISRTLELFVESLLTKTMKITNSRNAKTLSTSHMKQCIMAEQRFDFLRELVKNIPDINVVEESLTYNDDDAQSSPEEQYPDSDTPYDLSLPSTSKREKTKGNDYCGVNYTQQNSFNNTNTNCKMDKNKSNPIIMRTMSLANYENEQLPAKLARSDSLPAYQQQNSQQQEQQQEQQQHHRRRGKCNLPSIDATTTITSKPKNELSTALSSNNNPIVTIELQLPISMAPPASIENKGEIDDATMAIAADFEEQPVINIDLSNIVASTSCSLLSKNLSPAMASISIGTLPPVPSIEPKFVSNSKAIITDHHHCTQSISQVTPHMTTAKHSFFELDEDYDNI